MRRLAALTVVSLLVMAFPAVTAFGGTAKYADDFSEGHYSGNDGSLLFPEPWEEFGDGGTGPGGGAVHIGGENCSNNQCLHIEPGIASELGIVRYADTSVFTSAQLKYDIVVDSGLLDLGQLQVRVYNGSTWVVVDTYNLAESVAKTKTIPLGSYLCEQFAVKFVVTGSVSFTGSIAIDKVEISGSTTSTTTTSTTTTTTAPTTTTTAPTTTTSRPTTTTSEPTTTTSEPTTTTTSEEVTTTSSGETTVTGQSASTTSTTSATTTTRPSSSTSTTVSGVVPPSDGDPPVFEAGIRDPGTGVIVNYQGGMNGEMPELDGVEVLSAEVTTQFSLAVEAFKTAKVWLAALSLMIAAALVSGMDHRRKSKGGLPLLSPGEPLVEG